MRNRLHYFKFILSNTGSSCGLRVLIVNNAQEWHKQTHFWIQWANEAEEEKIIPENIISIGPCKRRRRKTHRCCGISDSDGIRGRSSRMGILIFSLVFVLKSQSLRRSKTIWKSNKALAPQPWTDGLVVLGKWRPIVETVFVREQGCRQADPQGVAFGRNFHKY